MDRGAPRAIVHGLSKSWTLLKQLSTHTPVSRRWEIASSGHHVFLKLRFLIDIQLLHSSCPSAANSINQVHFFLIQGTSYINGKTSRYFVSGMPCLCENWLQLWKMYIFATLEALSGPSGGNTGVDVPGSAMWYESYVWLSSAQC